MATTPGTSPAGRPRLCDARLRNCVRAAREHRVAVRRAGVHAAVDLAGAFGAAADAHAVAGRGRAVRADPRRTITPVTIVALGELPATVMTRGAVAVVVTAAAIGGVGWLTGVPVPPPPPVVVVAATTAGGRRSATAATARGRSTTTARARAAGRRRGRWRRQGHACGAADGNACRDSQNHDVRCANSCHLPPLLRLGCPPTAERTVCKEPTPFRFRVKGFTSFC